MQAHICLHISLLLPYVILASWDELGRDATCAHSIFVYMFHLPADHVVEALEHRLIACTAGI